MDNYAKLLLDLVTKPQVAKTTEKVTAPSQGQGLDLSSLLMMLMFSGVFDKDKDQATSALGTTPLGPSYRVPDQPGTRADEPYSGASLGTTGLGESGLPGGMTIADFMKMLTQ